MSLTNLPRNKKAILLKRPKIKVNNEIAKNTVNPVYFKRYVAVPAKPSFIEFSIEGFS